jgi:hypothetical protein
MFILGLENDVIDYDARKRDMKIENDLAYTLDCLEISQQILEISDAQRSHY